MSDGRRNKRGEPWFLALVAIATAVLGSLSPARAAPSRDIEPPAVVTPDSPAPRPVLPFRVVALGSSSTEGVGATSPSRTYPARLAALFATGDRNRFAVTVTNRGIGGETILDMMRRIGPDVLARKPDLVIWQVGSNDALKGVSVEQFESLLRQGIDTMEQSGTEVVLMEPQWSPLIEKADAASRFVDAVREVGRQAHVLVLRRYEMMQHWVRDGLATEDDLIGPDHLHMTDKGYGLLAQAVYDELSAHSAALRARLAVAAAKRP